MSAKSLKEKAERLELQRSSKHKLLQKLIVSGFFDTPKTTQELILEIRQTFGKKLRSNEVQTYMKKFLENGIMELLEQFGTIKFVATFGYCVALIK